MRDILRIILRLSWFLNIDVAYDQQNNAFKISQALIFAQWRDDLKMNKQIVWCSSPPQHYSQFVSDACVTWIESWIFGDDRKIHPGKANIAKEHWSEMSRCISYWFNGDIPASYVIVSSRGRGTSQLFDRWWISSRWWIISRICMIRKIPWSFARSAKNNRWFVEGLRCSSGLWPLKNGAWKTSLSYYCQVFLFAIKRWTHWMFGIPILQWRWWFYGWFCWPAEILRWTWRWVCSHQLWLSTYPPRDSHINIPYQGTFEDDFPILEVGW